MNDTGQTALTMAAGMYQGDAEETVRLLLAAGADVSLKGDETNWTPLLEAAHIGQAGAAKLLVENGANVNDRDRQGSTPLMLAAESARDKVVRVLIDAGADLNAKDNEGKTAVMRAAESTMIDRDQIVAMLKEAGAER